MWSKQVDGIWAWLCCQIAGFDHGVPSKCDSPYVLYVDVAILYSFGWSGSAITQ